MNLGRAKLILIIAFTGLNMFLSYYLFWPDVGKLAPDGTATSAEQRTAEAFLNENNYYLRVSLDRSLRTSDFLTVSSDRQVRTAMLERYSEEIFLPVESIQTLYYRGEVGILAVHQNGLIQLKFESPILVKTSGSAAGEMDFREAVRRALEEIEMLPSDARFDYIERQTGDLLYLHYYQLFDGLPLFAGNIKVHIENNFISQVDIYWLSPLQNQEEREIEIISAAEALTNLVETLGSSEVARDVIGVDFGYFSGEYDAAKWEVPPVWRIIMDDGRLYYINAFTGNVEQEAVIPELLQ